MDGTSSEHVDPMLNPPHLGELIHSVCLRLAAMPWIAGIGFAYWLETCHNHGVLATCGIRKHLACRF